MSNSSSSGPPKGAAAQSILDPKHKNPFEFDVADPLVLFIVQAVIIISLCNLLGFFLKRIRQPKVISEVIGGIILGPTALGRIPHFTQAIFPKQSISYLSLVANIGLVLFLFIIGLEVDFKLLKKNSRAALGIGIIGLVIPFGIGALVSIGVYNHFIDSDAVKFTHFLLFICVAFAITAFPVLCRILTELKLLQTDVGSSTLAAGVTNDVVGWILLALAVTLVNSGAGLTALWVMLVVFGWALFLFVVVRPIFLIIARKSGSFESGPTPGITCLVLLMTFFSAWFTQIIGVHAIFGGFLVGVIMPHDGGFANILASKIEDLVTVFFLPLYFTLSGLSTDLGLLKDGSIWGWTICVLLAAQVSKFVPCFGMAMWAGMDWRESGAVGSLMACKGLVELIVLNIGLSAGVLNSRVFAMFVLMALVTTFVTTPLCLAFYPESYRAQKAERLAKSGEKSKSEGNDFEGDCTSEFLVVLSQLEHLPSVMAFVRLLRPSYPNSQFQTGGRPWSSPSQGKSDAEDATTRQLNLSTPSDPKALRISALRLQHLRERTSDVMKASEVTETTKHDPILNIFHTFASLTGVEVPSATMSIVPSEGFVREISRQAGRVSCQFIVLPWNTNLDRIPQIDGSSINPIEKMLSGSFNSSPQYANLVRSTFKDSACDVGVLIDSSKSRQYDDGQPSISRRALPEQSLFCAFLGGPDDRLALSLVLQISQRSKVPVNIIRVIRTDRADGNEGTLQSSERIVSKEDETQQAALNQITVHAGTQGEADTVYGNSNTVQALASETEDNLLWHKATEASEVDPDRIKTRVIETMKPFKTAVEEIQKADGIGMIVFCGRSRQGGTSHRIELGEYLKDLSGMKVGNGKDVQQPQGGTQELVQRLGIAASSEVRKSLGDLTSGLVATQLKCKIMVVQSSSLKNQSGDSNGYNSVMDQFGIREEEPGLKDKQQKFSS